MPFADNRGSVNRFWGVYLQLKLEAWHTRTAISGIPPRQQEECQQLLEKVEVVYLSPSYRGKPATSLGIVS
jgi:hypothetical protein